MDYALIIAGGSGTRLWPMSRQHRPKQLIPFIQGQSLLQIAAERVKSLIDDDHLYICAGETHRQTVHQALPGLTEHRFLGEPMGRDTLNAVGLGCAVIGQKDPDAVIGVFTADHLIEPVDQFQETVQRAFTLAQTRPDTLVTFGITPTEPATAYGYLELGSSLEGRDAHVVTQFKEKPNAPTAQKYFQAGRDHYLWNSGMFVWKAATLLRCIERYCPDNYAGLMQIAQSWDSDQRNSTLAQVYPTLKKISIDYAVMERAASDSQVSVAAVPMALKWLDVGSWPAYAATCPADEHHNTIGAEKHLAIDTHHTLLASSEPDHLIATIGCEDLLIIHTADATLVCRKDRAEDVKKITEMVRHRYGDAYL